ncbi:MAG: DNA methyltransferase, partial [Planctomycetota bacterium]
DPACGSGNFLYVALELMKRLEGEVLKALRDFGDRQQVLLTIDPHQFLGIEVNPRAAAITDLVLWIGYLQWHLRTRGDDELHEPIIRNFHNIECRDAVLAWDSVEPVLDEQGKPVTRWDGRTTKPHPVTGEEVPDETARIQELRYINPRKAEWPKADYIVGNPPFVGDKMMKGAMGYGYVNTLRATYKALGGSADFVMYWWNNAAEIVAAGNAKRFGFIATNSLRQNYNRRTIIRHMAGKPPISLLFAIPDHPWVDSADGADVRISITVGTAGDELGELRCVTDERFSDEHPAITFSNEVGRIGPDLTIGADVTCVGGLQANAEVSCPGVKLFGQGFVVTDAEAKQLGLGRIPDAERYIRPYLIAREFTQSPKRRFVLDFLGLEPDQIRDRFPECYQWLLDRVKPERDQNNRASYRKWWWLFGEPRKTFRKSFVGITRQIVTPETSKHRTFAFLPNETVAEGTLVVVSLDDAFHLGVLSSRTHVTWALAAGGRLGVGNDPRYNKTRCFEPFPFPMCNAETLERIRVLGEQLDAHRKRQQQLHPELTMTGMYNVLEKLRAAERAVSCATGSASAGVEIDVALEDRTGTASGTHQNQLTAKERVIHEQGLVSVLKQIHDELDAAVCDAYGWPHNLDDEEILQRLVDLNHERAAEEARGVIRWLRPEFQNPGGKPAIQTKLDIDEPEPEPIKAKPAKLKKQAWPAALPDRFSAVRTALTQHTGPANATDVAKYFSRARKANVEEILDTLVSVGQVRQTDDGRYVA